MYPNKRLFRKIGCIKTVADFAAIKSDDVNFYLLMWIDIHDVFIILVFLKTVYNKYISVQFSPSVMSDSLRPHRLQHARPPCPSPTSRIYSSIFRNKYIKTVWICLCVCVKNITNVCFEERKYLLE